MNFPARSLPELVSFLDGQAEPRIVIDADFRIVAANRTYSREFAQGRPLGGRHCYEVSHHFTVPCDQAGESCPLRMSQESGQAHRVLHLHHTPRGEEHVDVETTPIRDQQGDIAYFVETLRVVKQASSGPAAEGLVGRSPSFNRMLALVMRVAPTDAAVLLLGETGTGKELVAQLLHEAGKHEAGPFVAVDCSGLTETLFESELFGYEKGAFTGALSQKIGRLELAHHGTLFLDEVGDIPLDVQPKLLRALQEKEFERLGSTRTIPVDLRLIAATNRDLGQMVRDRQFRSDLYYRLNVFPVFVPPLRARPGDIPLLTRHFVEKSARRMNKRIDNIPARTVEALRTWHWPGNVRELENFIERAVILTEGTTLQAPLSELTPSDNSHPPAPVSLHDAEREHILSALRESGGIIGGPKGAAARLGIKRTTLNSKMRKLNISRRDV
jgi:two-component system response regulator HydG